MNRGKERRWNMEAGEQWIKLRDVKYVKPSEIFHGVGNCFDRNPFVQEYNPRNLNGIDAEQLKEICKYWNTEADIRGTRKI